MTRRNRDLENRLEEWGREYGGGKYEDIGALKSWLGSMVKWGGRAPTGLGQVPLNTAADDVQEAIDALAKQSHGELPALVIRCEYLTPGQPIYSKLGRLRRIGHNVGNVRYYQHLRLARIHVAAWLRIPYADTEEAA
jgi:hypothetical protein